MTDRQHTFALEFLESLPLDSFDTILDVGAGPGYQTQWLLEHGKQAQAVDLRPPSIDVPFVRCEACEISRFAPCDAIWSHHMLEHVETPLAVLREFHRTLKPGGWLFLTVPQIDDVVSPGHIVGFTMPLLAYHLAMTGFDMADAYYGKFRSHLRVAVRSMTLPASTSLLGLAHAGRLPASAARAVIESGRFNATHVPNRWFPR